MGGKFHFLTDRFRLQPKWICAKRELKYSNSSLSGRYKINYVFKINVLFIYDYFHFDIILLRMIKLKLVWRITGKIEHRFFLHKKQLLCPWASEKEKEVPIFGRPLFIFCFVFVGFRIRKLTSRINDPRYKYLIKKFKEATSLTYTAHTVLM
jgi:hypothetical protein